MISHLSHTSVFVLDQDSAKAFYTEKLGFELRFDITMGDEFEGSGAGFRWLTVGAKDQPDLQLILTSHHPYIIQKIPIDCWKIVTRKGTITFDTLSMGTVGSIARPAPTDPLPIRTAA